MKRTIGVLCVVSLAGCAWLGFGSLLGIGDEVEHVAKHSCACDPNPDEEARAWVRCTADGKEADNGTHLCCPECHKVCGRWVGKQQEQESKPPVPVPLPPRCDLATHCKSKEACVVGDHECCSACHQACL